jgi:hypothetical protein
LSRSSRFPLESTWVWWPMMALAVTVTALAIHSVAIAA